MINIYKASAGSGKTFTLAREYIKLLLGRKKDDGSYSLGGVHHSHRHILAITFTNKATEEMKTRIIHELALLAGFEKNDKKSDYLNYLCDCFACNEEALRKEASRALKELLYDFSFFGISTIDSFFQTILRAFAREAEVSGNYDLELDDKAIIAMSIDKLLQDLNHGEETKSKSYLIKWLTDYMTALIEEGKTFNIFNRSSQIHGELISFVNDITDDDYRENEENLLRYFSDEKQFGEFKSQIFNTIRDSKETAKEACQTAMNLVESLDAQSLINSNVLKPIATWAKSGFEKKSLSATVRKAMDDIYSAYKKNGLNSPLRDRLDPVLCTALQCMKGSYNVVRTLNIISRNHYQLGLLSTIVNYLDKYRRENSTILLSDTNSLISKIIGVDKENRDSADAPFLYERVGVRYHNYLIDEFQDTSHSQWLNIRPLIKESLAHGYDNLVIGDEKQCIYRFRNSDPTLLHKLHEEPMAAGCVNITGDKLSENTNWRSSRDVIEFNNRFFSSLVSILDFEDIYSNVRQQVSPKHTDHRGYIVAKQYVGSKKDDWYTEALDFTASHIRRQLEAGYNPGDIAILVRRGDEGRAVINYLEALKHSDPTFPDFRIVSDASLIIGNSPTVSLIISRLRLLASTDFTADPRKKSQREVAALINRFETFRSTGTSPSEALVSAIKGNDSPGFSSVNSNPQAASAVDLITLVETIIDDFVPTENLRSDYQFIAALQEMVTEFVRRGQGDIRSFLRWWDDSGSRTAIAGANDRSAINILTIHKSKGLEFPCVIIPFAHLGAGINRDLSWFKIGSIPGFDDRIIPPMLPLQLSADMKETVFEQKYSEVVRENKLDDLNLLYVAFTRAIDELIIGFPPGSARNSGMSKDISDGLKAAFPEFDDSFEQGSPTKPSEKPDKTSGANKPTLHVDMDSYHTSHHRDIWAKTRLEDKYYSIAEARDRGTLLHDIMASISHRDDVDTAINSLRYLRKAKNLSEKDLDGISSIIKKRVNDPQASRWFDGFEKVMTERPISISPDDTIRPDRVVWTADGYVDVIDFKSGSQPPQRYFKKMKDYKDSLIASGHDRVRGFLYYLDSGKIIEV